MKKGKVTRLENGFYDYVDEGNVVWRLMNMGYTIGYACVMWRGHKRDEPTSMLREEIWARSKKSLINIIEERRNLSD